MKRIACAALLAAAAFTPDAEAIPKETVEADLASGLMEIKISAEKRTGRAPNTATGHAEAIIPLGPGQILTGMAGPITCLDVRDRNIGMYFPVTKVFPAGPRSVRFGVFLNVTTDGAGHARSVTYLPTVSGLATRSCAPTDGVTPATGDVLVGR